MSIVAEVRDAGAKVAVDTGGNALTQIVRLGGIWLIKPNVEELRELLGEHVADEASAIAEASRGLCDKVQMVLVSRAGKGATLITKDVALQGEVEGQLKQITRTVGCGDYLLGGFLKGFKDKSDAGSALGTAIKVATAKAWGWVDEKSWLGVQSKIKVQVRQM